jgi:uncharacterized protein
MTISSAIYTGYVEHQRFLPKPHQFKYSVFMMYLDLDELPQLFENQFFWSYNTPNLAYFRRADYFGDASKPLKQEISNLLLQATGYEARGKVRLLTNMRYFGHCFNPVSFYYCFEADGETLQAIVTHITNTPWGESYAYVHDYASEHFVKQTKNGPISVFNLDKKFHVSPFMPMNINYDWAFKLAESQLLVHMKNFKDNSQIFNATLSLKREDLTSFRLNWLLLTYPPMSLKVVLGIYWNALLLWLKRIPFYSHPNHKSKHE